MDGGPQDIPEAVARALDGPPPRAGSFIVTIYGDVVEPRGGTLWMGTLIEVCAGHGISEGLVRTAVSRLVASGRLSGQRRGRKSYYRLTPAARREFARAASILFAVPPSGRGWLFHFGAGELPAKFAQAGWASGSGYAVGPDREDLPRPEGLTFTATAFGGMDLRDFAGRHWDLAPVAAGYREFIDAFGPVAESLGQGYNADDTVSLALRLRAVHEFRRAVLSDPRLPGDALPPDWPSREARRLFVSLYLALTESADRHVGATFRDESRLLPAVTAATARRIATLGDEVLP